MKNYENHHELTTCIQELQGRLEKTKMIHHTKHLCVVDKLTSKSSFIGGIEIYALADALQHTTDVIYRILQRSYGIELRHFQKDLLRTCQAIEVWHDRFRKCTAKLDASIIKSSHPIGSLLALLSLSIRKFRQIFEDYIQEISSGELECNILWLKRYPWLKEVEEVVGEPRMGPAQPLFDVSYWSRMWIRQEVILAKHPVFACGSRAFSVETLELFSAWKAGLSKLIMAYQRIWKLLHHIFDCRQTQGQSVGHWLSIRGLKPNIWCFSSDTRASNPKDYYYGFLALTNLEITPDYDSTKTLGLISREYVSEYLRAFRNKSFSNILSEGPLGLLMFAGVGYGWDMDPDMPSWGPNFPGQAQAKPSSRGSADAIFLESAEGFESIFRTESDAAIAGPDLEVSAIILDRIENIGPRVSDYGRFELLHPEGLPITWALDFALRHSRYVSGGHPLAALRTLLDPSVVPESAQIDPPVEDCLDFIKFLARFNYYPRPETKLPLSVSWKRRLCYVKELLEQVPDPVDDDDEDNYDEEISYIQTLGSKCKPYSHSIAETRKGYVGRFPPKIQEGDLICLLHGLDHVAVIRRRGKYFQFVGTCFIIGMRRRKQIHALVELYSLKAEKVTLR
ncbi:Ff.00g116940.m01.CDS01 [Fusarium sp. VM40]|nr:Ff.00g116940.m01.CDS01 [Fusarium sp. VM40]